MLLKRRLGVAFACVGLVAAAALLLHQSHAQATSSFSYSKFNNIQKRIASQTLASLMGTPTATRPGAMPPNDDGGGPDGAPFTPPKSYQAASSSASGVGNYFPSGNGKCSNNLGGNIKVNQNCLNISDPDLQGRAQANNETSIAQNPNNTNDIVGSDNNYIRGDGTCGAHYSTKAAAPGRTRPSPTASPGVPRATPASTGRPVATPPSPGTRAATRT